MEITQIPYDETAELAVLGAALIRPEALLAVSDLSGDDFLAPANRYVLDALRRAHKAGKPLDPVTVVDELVASGVDKRVGDVSAGGALAYLIRAMGAVPTAENVTHYAGIVAEKARGRRLMEIAGRIMARAQSGERSQDIGSDVLRDVGRALTAREDIRTLGYGDNFLDEMETRVASFARGGRPESMGISTSLASVDEIIGGIVRTEVLLVAAHTGHGKSAFAMQAALNHCLKGGVAVVFPLEMSAAQLKERCYSHMARINSYNLRRGIVDKAGWDDLNTAATAFAKLKLYVDTKARDIAQIEASAAQIKAKHPDEEVLVVVDYAQLVASRGITDRVQRITDVSWRLKSNIASALDVSVIEVAQPNRTGKKSMETSGSMEISDLDGAGALENDAATILIIDNKGRKDGEGDVEIHAKKSRSGPGGTAHTRWIGRWYMFTDEGAGGPPLGPARGQFASRAPDNDDF